MALKKFQTEEVALSPSWFDQVNVFAQKHAQLMVFCSSLLVVLIVLVIANYYWNQSRLERALDSIAAAVASAELQALREEVRSLPEVHAQLLLRLGDLLYREGRLEDARKAFTEFRQLYPRHVHLSAVERALKRLGDDISFVENVQVGMVRQHELFGHPALRSARHASEPGFGPPRPVRPVLEIETTLHGDEKRRSELRIELLPEDAEKACAHLIELAKKDHFRGLTWEIVEQGRMIRTGVRPGVPPAADIPTDPSNLPIEEGAVMLVPGDSGKDQPARFQIALKELPELSGRVTVVGYVVGQGLPDLMSISASDKILSCRLLEAGAPHPPLPFHRHENDQDHDHDHKH